MHAAIKWQKEGMKFECDNNGIKTPMDHAMIEGQKAVGPSPKELLLNAMMGCTAMDVIAILKKMRQPLEDMNVTIDAVKNTEHPIHFKHALIEFHLQGDIAEEKALKAVNSSLTKYCGVNYMASKTCEIEYKIFINKDEKATGKANFITP